ncbi:LysR family transcriptional regulator [Aureimonas sp. AU12]|uniref:LysR family transcriptional regulator n=1 Tax=Aureimonas sp. AU12 TaxID=1638161 RepID=UPI0007855C05|nr:LysR family transcriptional regulator [Aureimonas sp. AU12]
MKREDWADLAHFAVVAELRSFTRAALAVGVSPSALSHAMRSLEARHGVRLLNRTTRSVAPTPAGEALLRRIAPALAEIRGATQALAEGRERPAGRVRISAHRTAAIHAILPRLPGFAAAFPEIELELAIEDGIVDIVAGGFDAGVRHGHKLDQDMISVRVGGAGRVVVAATPAYFRDHPAPLRPQEIVGHRCLNYRYVSSGQVARWDFLRAGEAMSLEAPGAFVANDVDLVLAAALAGLGLARLSMAQAAPHLASGALVEVLADWAPEIPANYLYYPGRRHVGPALRAFIDAVRDRTA